MRLPITEIMRRIDEAIRGHRARDHGPKSITAAMLETGVGLAEHGNEYHAPDFEEEGVAAGLVTAHAGAADPHTGYQKESEKGAASGYAGLDAGTKVPTAQLGGAGADNTKYLRGDQSWQVPAGGGATEMDDLTDADTTTDAPALSEVLKWNGLNWVPAPYNYEFAFSMDTFADALSAAIQLIGAGTWKAINAISFTVVYHNPPGGMTAYVVMAGSATPWGANLDMTGTPPDGPTLNTEAVVYPSSAVGTITFVLHQSVDATTLTLSHPFSNTMRYGNSALGQGSETEASLEALTEVSGPSESRTQTINNIATTAAHLVFAYATRLSDVTQVRMDSGWGFVSASFNATRTTLAPTIQEVAACHNSLNFTEAMACLTATDHGLANGTNDFQLLQSATAQNYLYWGELNKASGYTEADVEGNYATQPGKTASNTISSRSMVVNATGSEYTYIAYPARLGALTSIVIGGFESIGDFNVDNTALAVTNDGGYTEDYRVYVSKNPGFTDPTTMTVTI